MRYRVFETMLNEYTGHDQKSLLMEVEAESEQEAMRQARMVYPSNPSITVSAVNDNQTGV